MIFLKSLLLIVSAFLIGINAAVNTFQNLDGVYSECIKNGDIAITFGKFLLQNAVIESLMF